MYVQDVGSWIYYIGKSLCQIEFDPQDKPCSSIIKMQKISSDMPSSHLRPNNLDHDHESFFFSSLSLEYLTSLVPAESLGAFLTGRRERTI